MAPTLQISPDLTQIDSPARFSMWNFDLRRLEIYRRHNPHLAIDIQRIGPFLAMKFPEVGYFNRAIGPAEHFHYHEDELLEFYDRGDISFRLSLTGDPSERPVHLHPGFRVAAIEEYYLRSTAGADPNKYRGWTFEKVAPNDFRRFFELYLQHFAGPTCIIEQAVENMQHLGDMSGLHCSWVHYHGRLVGFGMWHWQGSNACMCGGGILSPHRRNEGHQAILEERMRASRGFGCSQAVSVARSGSEAAKNLQDCGFRLFWQDEALQWVGSLKRAKLVI